MALPKSAFGRTERETRDDNKWKEFLAEILGVTPANVTQGMTKTHQFDDNNVFTAAISCGECLVHDYLILPGVPCRDIAAGRVTSYQDAKTDRGRRQGLMSWWRNDADCCVHLEVANALDLSVPMYYSLL
jgi:hypothetical protein